VGAGERPAAYPPVDLHRGRQHALDDGRALAVAELTEVEVPGHPVDPLHPEPPEEDVARGLRQSLAGHDALAGVRVLARRQEALEDRLLRLLDLQEQRVLIVAAEHERDEGARPDAPDADDLARQVDEAVLLEDVAPVDLEGPPVAPQDLADLARQPLRVIFDELADGNDQRRIAPDKGRPSTCSTSFA
jgi:hypothetical protein